MSLHHPIRFYLGFMFAILYSMTSSAYGANVVSLDTNAGYAGTEVVVALSIDNDSTLAGLQFTIQGFSGRINSQISFKNIPNIWIFDAGL